MVLLVLLASITVRRDGGLQPWEPSLLAAIFLGATFVARPVQLLWGGTGSLWQGQSDLMSSLPAANIAVFVFLLTASSAFLLTARHEPALAPMPITWSRTDLRIAVTVAAMGAVASLLIVAGSLSGIVALVTNSFGRRSLLESRFYLLFPIYGMVAVALFFVAAFAQRRIGPVAFVSAIVACSALLLPLGGRGEFLKLGLMALGTWQAFGRRVRAPAMIAAVIVAYLIISVGFALRLTTGPTEQLGRERLGTVSVSPQVLVPSVVRDGFTGFDRFAFALPRIPDDIPFQGWTSFGRLLAAPVPRAMWPGKPGLSEASITARLFGTDVGRYPITVVGQAWLQAGIAGLILMGGVQGLIWSFIRGRMYAARTATGRVGCVVASVTLFGALDNLSIVQFVMRIVPVVVLGNILERSVGSTRVRRNEVPWRLEEVSPVSVG
jgi:hypothetical protein